MSITTQQKANLLLAIERAVGPGECKYVIDGKPGCVIGQLAAIEGANCSDWGAFQIHHMPYVLWPHQYNTGFLHQLQRIWDAGEYPDPSRTDVCEGEDARRAEMRTLVEAQEVSA